MFCLEAVFAVGRDANLVFKGVTGCRGQWRSRGLFLLTDSGLSLNSLASTSAHLRFGGQFSLSSIGLTVADLLNGLWKDFESFLGVCKTCEFIEFSGVTRTGFTGLGVAICDGFLGVDFGVRVYVKVKPILYVLTWLCSGAELTCSKLFSKRFFKRFFSGTANKESLSLNKVGGE